MFIIYLFQRDVTNSHKPRRWLFVRERMNPSMLYILSSCSSSLLSSVVVWCGGGRRLIFNLFGSFSFPCSVRNRVSSIISHFSHGPGTLNLIHQPKHLLEIHSVCELFSVRSIGGVMLVKQPIVHCYRRLQGPQGC